MTSGAAALPATRPPPLESSVSILFCFHIGFAIWMMYDLNPIHHLPSYVARYLPGAIAPPPTPWYQQIYTQASSPFASVYSTLRTTMDALLSIPALSFLLIPTMTSYSTSLNLLFFYLTWSTLVLSHPPLRVEIFGTLAIRILFYIIPSFLFLLFDALLPSAAINFKHLSDRALPLTSSSRNAKIRLGKVVLWSLFNLILGVVVQALIEVLFVRVLGIRSALRVTTSLPMPWAIFIGLARGFLLREIFAYVIHRYILHNPDFSISKLHLTWYHSIAAPYPFTANYDHPLPYLLHKFLPTYLPALLFRTHLLTHLLFLILISLEETFSHSGYSSVPTNFILGGIARRADAHVLCHGDGNFGPVGILDWIMGTSIGGDIFEDVKAEAEKHDVPEKIEEAKAGAKRKGSEVLNGVRSRAGGKGRRRREQQAVED